MAGADRWVIESQPSARFPWYTRANAGEVLPDPVTPLGWSLAWEQGVLQGFADGYVTLGCLRPEEMADVPPPVAGVFGGYYYNNMSAARMNGVRIPGLTVEAFDAALFGSHPAVPPYEPHPDDECEECTAKVAEKLGWIMTAEAWPELDEDKAMADAARAGRPDLTTLSPAELVGRARSFLPLCARFFSRHVWATVAGTVGPGAVGAVLGAIGRPELIFELLAGIGGVDSALPANALWDLSRLVRSSEALTSRFDEGSAGTLVGAGGGDGEDEDEDEDEARFRASFAAFLVDYGFRGPNEWDPGAPSWEVRPAMALAFVERLRRADDGAAPSVQFEQRKARREQLTAELAEQLQRDAEAQGTLLAGVRSGAFFLAARERTKSNCIRAINEMRAALFELGGREAAAGALEEAGDIFLLLDRELDGHIEDPASTATLVAERKAVHRSLFDLEPPFFLTEAVPLSEMPQRRLGTEVPLLPGEVLHGAPGCPGTAAGRARIITDPGDPSALAPGDVLVAPLTDPSWTPLFVAASAVIVDVGAPNSHAVIVSRELGIPCVVSATDATRRIPDGALVSVDGTAGTVTLGG